MKYLMLLILLTGCSSSLSLKSRLHHADTIAGAHRFHKRILPTSPFSLLSYTKFNPTSTTLKVYIEGDGFAWITKNRLSQNPTPRHPFALELAAQETTTRSVAYLARACHYITSPNCHERYWSTSRFSKEIINSMDQALTLLKKASGSRYLELFGYSGGGTLAVMLAARRNDITHITTFGANLNLRALEHLHQTTPLHNALGPIDIAPLIAHIPQHHYVGEADRVVPPSIAYSFKKASINLKNIIISPIKGATHRTGWIDKVK
jgi:hypothetical protein